MRLCNRLVSRVTFYPLRAPGGATAMTPVRLVASIRRRKMERTSSGFALRRRLTSAPDSVTMCGHKSVEPIAQLTKPRQVVQIRCRSKAWACPQCAHERLKSAIYAAVRGDQVHCLHAGLVRNPGKSIKCTQFLKIDRNDSVSSSQGHKPLHLSDAESAMPVIEDNVLVGRRRTKNGGH